MGGGAFKPRPLELEGVEGYENIHYHVSNIQQYAGKKVTILGGGDSAVDWALAFEKIAPTTLVHRRDNFRALEHSVQDLQESSLSYQHIAECWKRGSGYFHSPQRLLVPADVV